MTQKSLQAPVLLPQESQIPASHGESRRLPWMAIAIVAIIIAAVAIALALGFVLGAKGANVPPAKAPEPTPIIAQNPAANAVAPMPVVIVTPGPTPIPQFGAAPIPGNGITLGIYTKPGKPGEMTDGGQIAASFILLAASGRIEEALKLAGPAGATASLVKQAKLLAERYPNGFKKGVEIRSFGSARPAYLGSILLYEDIHDLDTGYAVFLGDRYKEDGSLDGFLLSKSELEPWRIYYPDIPFSGYGYEEGKFTPITFTTAPVNPKTVVERIAAIYLLAAERKIDEAVAFAPAAYSRDWRLHLQVLTESKRLRSIITITAVRQEPEAPYRTFNTNVTAARVCVEVADGNITKLAPC